MKLIGVAGGSGSGKTYFVRALQESLGPDSCAIIYQDNYYIDQSAKFDFDGGSVNFDHPDAIDFNLIEVHLRALRDRQSIQVPIYDFKTHKRIPQTISVEPKPFVLVDGILILCMPFVRKLFDETVFVETSESLRFSRRLKRDIEERGRTKEGVENQFYKQVKPMHDLFVEPTKHLATFVLREDDSFSQQLQQFHRLLNTEGKE
ncbi:MAG: uridine/cytidine kinase [Pseudomonadota bacterium]